MGCNNSKNAETSNQNKPEEKPETQEQETPKETGENGADTNKKSRTRMLSVYSETNEMASSEYEEFKKDLLQEVTENEESNNSPTETGDSNTVPESQDEPIEEDHTEATTNDNDKDQSDSTEQKEDQTESKDETDNADIKEESQTESVEELTAENKELVKREELENSDKYIEDSHKQDVQQDQGQTADDIKSDKETTEEQPATEEGNEGGEAKD